MRRASAIVLCSGCSVVSGVSGDVGLPCESDGACPPALLCVAGRCADDDTAGEGEGEGEDAEAPRIDLVDGDGTLLAPRLDPQPGQQFAPHRLGALVVTGADLAGATVVVVDEAGLTTALPVLTESAVRLTLSSAFPHAGLFTLVLTTVAGVAQAQVFVLQGEPGPPGPPGELTPFTCDDDGNCLLTGTLSIDGALSVNGRAAAATLPPGVTVVTATTEAELRQRLAELDGVIIGSGSVYRVELPVLALALTAPLVVQHPDGQRIQIIGNSAAAPTVVSGASSGAFSITDGGLGLLDNVTIVGPGLSGGTGVFVTAARASLGPNVEVRSYSNGVLASDVASINVLAGATVADCGNGFVSLFSSVVRATGAVALNNTNSGFIAQFQASVFLGQGIAQGNGRGVVAASAGEVFFPGATITNNQLGGVIATSLSHGVGGLDCRVENNGNAVDLVAASGSLIEAAGCSFDTSNGNVTP